VTFRELTLPWMQMDHRRRERLGGCKALELHQRVVAYGWKVLVCGLEAARYRPTAPSRGERRSFRGIKVQCAEDLLCVHRHDRPDVEEQRQPSGRNAWHENAGCETRLHVRLE